MTDELGSGTAPVCGDAAVEATLGLADRGLLDEAAALCGIAGGIALG